MFLVLQDTSRLAELEGNVPEELRGLLEQRDGTRELVEKLAKRERDGIEKLSSDADPSDKPWADVAKYYMATGRIYDALCVWSTLYDELLGGQTSSGQRRHKGLPLVHIADIYQHLGSRALAKRYLMLTLCEDAMKWKGEVDVDRTGSYFRLVWWFGLPDVEFRRYATEAFQKYQKDAASSVFPERVLQELDTNWMCEIPSAAEANIYRTNTHYVTHLISKLGSCGGTELELLADYLLSCIPGCRTARRQRSQCTEYDLVCSIEQPAIDFRSELGRYFVCECKDWDRPADFGSFAKLCRVLDSTKSRFGIMFAKRGISGKAKGKHASREQQKVFQDRGTVIVVVDEKDLRKVAKGGSFINILREKYEEVRLDLTAS